ncbi:MAG: hypothetical protein ACM3X5_09030 [Bacillota bacterium]
MTTLGYPDGTFRAGDVHVGDNVTVTTPSHEQFQFVVTAVSADQICGPARCFDTRDVAWVQRTEINWAATIAGASATALMAVLFAAAKLR